MYMQGVNLKRIKFLVIAICSFTFFMFLFFNGQTKIYQFMFDDANAIEFDGVPNSYRYYKVSEYIYQNYIPLCSYKDIYAIWCLPERYDEMNIKIQNMIAGKIDLNEDIKLIDYGYDGPYLQEDGENYSYLPAVHNYNIGKLPVIWAESDSKKV